MKADAASAGLFDGQKMKCPRIQLLTIEGLLSGTQRAEHPDYVPNVNFKKAKREKGKRHVQPEAIYEQPGEPNDNDS